MKIHKNKINKYIQQKYYKIYSSLFLPIKVFFKLYLKFYVKNIFSKKTEVDPNADYGTYCGFSIWEGSCCSEGHFWGDRNKITDKLITENLIELFENHKKERPAWPKEDYKKQLYRNLEANNVLQYYKDHYGIKQDRLLKLKKLQNGN